MPPMSYATAGKFHGLFSELSLVSVFVVEVSVGMKLETSCGGGWSVHSGGSGVVMLLVVVVVVVVVMVVVV